jgi:hypothetical protein
MQAISRSARVQPHFSQACRICNGIVTLPPLPTISEGLSCATDLHELFRFDAYGQFHNHKRAEDGDF